MINLIKKCIITSSLALTGGVLLAQNAEPAAGKDQEPNEQRHNLKTWSIGARALHLFDLPAYRFDTDLNRDMRGLNGDNTKVDLGMDIYLEKQFTPLFGMQLGFRYGNMTGANEVEYYENTFNEVYLDMSFMATNLDRYFAQTPWNIYGKAGAGYGSFDATQYLIFDDVTDGSEAGTFWEVHGGAGVQYELTSALRLELELMLNFSLTDGFDGYDSGTGSDQFLSTGLGLAYTFGAPEKKPMYAVSYFGDEYLNLDRKAATPSPEKAEPEVKAEELAELKDKLAKMEGKLAEQENSENQEAQAPVEAPPAAPATEKQNIAAAYFAFDSSSLSREAKMQLSEELAEIENKAGRSVQLVAYADKKGSDTYNQQLKKRRGETVKDFLVEMGFERSNIELELGKPTDYSDNNQFLNRKVIVKY